ncbi:fibronectin type III domain-containing protein [Hymenobacter sp. B81]|uniref:fibronectin type III domain-containing protein n=1 Tax=Hymenobacter sp. B81 TaxID=3344878 RepID=UPI0037DCC1B9
MPQQLHAGRARTTRGPSLRPRLSWLLALLTLLAPLSLRAQVNLYTFAQSTGTYAPLTGGTAVATAVAGATSDPGLLDDAVFTLPDGTIPFGFNFGGSSYTGFRVSTNGFMTFGATAPAGTTYTPLSSATGYAGAIAPLGRDLSGSLATGSLGEIRYETLGSAPNRTFVVQWRNFLRYDGGYRADNLNFQVRLSEGSNQITFAYGTNSVNSAVASTTQVGLRGASNTVYYNRTSTTSWSATAAGTANTAVMTLSSTVRPASGLQYTFTPPVPCTAPPVPGTAVASVTTGCGTVASTTLSLSGAAPGTGVTYQWQQSATGAPGSYSNVSGVGTNPTYTATNLTSNTYFQAVVTCSGQAVASGAALVRVYPAAVAYASLPVTQGFETWPGRCGNSEVPGDNWRNTPLTGDNSWRRNDQGFATSAWRYINDEPAPYMMAASQGSYSARFHTYGTAAGGIGSLDLFVDLSDPGTKTLTFDYINPTGTDKLDVLLSTDGGLTFDATPLLSLGTAGAFGGRSVTFAANSATSVIRFRATSDFGADDLGFDNLKLEVTPACPGVAFGPTTNITSTAATLNFAAAPGATSYTVTYSPGGSPQTVTSADSLRLTGLTPYTVYTVTVTTNCGGGQTATATTSFRTGIGNDECSGAIALTPGAPGASCTGATYTTAGATSSGVTSPCTALADGDVWFSFVATGARHSISVTPVFDFDAVIELRTGVAGCTGTNISCQNASASGGGAGAETLVATGLTPGATYFVRVYSAVAGSGSGNFDICITTPANLPCAAVTNAAVANTGSTATASTAQLTFDAAPDADSYFLTLTPTAGGPVSTATLSGSPVNLTGLTPSTSYTVTITTNCSNGGVSSTVTVVFTSAAPPAVPVNNECSGAIALTPGAAGASCTATAGTTAGATASTGSLGTCVGTADDDVWYSFVATATQHTVSVTGSSSFDAVLNLRSGACPGTNLVACADNSGAAGTESITATGLTVGATYLVRVFDYFTGSGSGNFTICVTTPAPCAAPSSISSTAVMANSANITFVAGNGATSYTVTATPASGPAITASGPASPVALTGLAANTQYAVTVTSNCGGGQTATSTPAYSFTTMPLPPTNDNCATATALTVGAPGAACSTTAGTTRGATASAGANPCGGNADDDVWYSFVATATQHTITVAGATGFDAVVNLRGGSCASGASLQCVDNTFGGGTETLVATGLTVGSTYYVRVFDYYATTYGNFTICVTSPANAPCAGVTNAAAGSITENTASLSFTAAAGATNYSVTLSDTTLLATGTFTTSPISLTGLQPGTQYTVTITTNCSNGGISQPVVVTFTTTAPPAAPANDNCSGAVALTPSAPGGSCSATNGTVAGATQSLAPIVCGGFTGTAPAQDVWYRFVATSTAHTISVTGTFDGVLDVRSGNCASSTNLACADASGNNETLNLSNLTVGTQYYLRYYPYSPNPASKTFSICVTTPAQNLVVDNTRSVQGTYNNVTITGSGVATLSDELVVTGTLTVQNGGVLNTNCQTISGPGSFVLQAGGQLSICSPAGIAPTGSTGAIQVSGARSYSNDATYVYAGSAPQSTGPGLPSRVRNLTVSNAAGLTLSSGLSVAQVLRLSSGNLTLNSRVLTLLSSADGTALVDNTGGTVNGAATVQRYISPALNAGPGYRHYSSPVSNTPVSDLTTAGYAPVVNPAYNSSATPNLVTPFPTVFGYDESRLTSSPATTLSVFDKGWFSPAAPSSPLAVGQGYTVNIPASQTVDFVGTLNNGPVSRSLARTTPAGGWHLVGNPYPAPLDWSQVAVPAGLDNAMYVFQSTSQYGGSYRSYVNGVGNPLIGLGQGFFVRVSQGSTQATLTLTNAARLTEFAPQPTFNRGGETRPLVQLALRGSTGLSDEAFVYFEAGATAGVDTRYDALKIQHNTGGAPSLYALAAGAELAINGLPQLTATTVVPLGVDVPRAGTYTFEASQLLNLASADAFLHDAVTGQTVNLRQQPSYSFAATGAALLNGRFTLRFEAARPLATHTGLTAAAVALFPNPAQRQATLLVPAVAGAGKVQVTLFNSLGQQVLTQTAALPAAGAQLTLDVQPLATGVYTVRVQAGDAQVTKRLAVE